MTRFSPTRRALAGGLIASPFVAMAARGQSLKKVSFLYDLQPYSKHALFYPGVDMGFFEKRGLDVQIDFGKGSADVAQKVAVKAATFGFVDAGVSILARGRGLPVKQVNMVHYNNMMTIIGKDLPPLTDPKSLEGRKIAASTGDAVKTALAAVCAQTGADYKKIEFITVEEPNKRPLLFAGQVDAACAYSVTLPVYKDGGKAVNMPISEIPFKRYGVDVYSNGVVAHDELLASDPALVKAFNDGLVDSMIWAVENRDAAVDILMKYLPKTNRELNRQGLDITIENLLVDEVSAHGIGPMAEEKWAKSIEFIRQYFGMSTKLTPGDVYANGFVTPGRKPKAA